ncbi:MAG: hypothetical protein IJ663_04300 [Spirochaetales bacterium]|nr:hypothetical protein [Spirochaetales bacterium]
MMTQENSMQMHMVMLGLEEGERRGRMKALRDAAYNMSDLGLDIDTIARYLDLSPYNLRYLVNCTDWDICSVTTTECRVNEPVYKTNDNHTETC